MNYRETIRNMFTDEDGNYQMGLENAITPEDLLAELGIDTVDDKTYQIARIELNAICSQITREGYCAGGVGRSPTHYMIAKNPTEERMIVNNSAKNNIGRLTLYMKRGKNMINTRVVKALLNQLQNFIDEEDGEQLLLDNLE